MNTDQSTLNGAPVVKEVVVIDVVNAFAFARHGVGSYCDVADAGFEPRSSPFARHHTACNARQHQQLKPHDGRIISSSSSASFCLRCRDEKIMWSTWLHNAISEMLSCDNIHAPCNHTLGVGTFFAAPCCCKFFEFTLPSEYLVKNQEIYLAVQELQ